METAWRAPGRAGGPPQAMPQLSPSGELPPSPGWQGHPPGELSFFSEYTRQGKAKRRAMEAKSISTQMMKFW